MIFIPENVPSSKNSKRWTGKILISPEATMNYIELTAYEWILKRDEFLDLIKGKEKPYKVGLFFIRKSRNHFDYINVCQIIADLMVKNEWLDDDDSDNFLPVFLGYRYDKENSGVEISVL